MLALASVFVVVLFSLLVTRIATVALTLTGLSRESARFQARSALSGAGFTTSEAEAVVNHPVRRRIVMILMLVGSAGIVTLIGTLVLSFAGAEGEQRGIRLAVLLGGLFVIWLAARSSAVDRQLSRLIGAVLDRWTDLDVRDYAALLHLSDRYAVVEIEVEPGDWVEGRTIAELRLRDEGTVLLGISRPGREYIAGPHFETEIRANDVLLLYGSTEAIRELDRRRAGPDGDEAHRAAVARARSLQAGSGPSSPGHEPVNRA